MNGYTFRECKKIPPLLGPVLERKIKLLLKEQFFFSFRSWPSCRKANHPWKQTHTGYSETTNTTENYRKNSKNWDTWNNYHNCPTIGTVGFYSAVLCSKDADRMTNREDPDQTAPWGAVWSGSALFAQTYLSQYLKLLRYKNWNQ